MHFYCIDAQLEQDNVDDIDHLFTVKRYVFKFLG